MSIVLRLLLVVVLFACAWSPGAQASELPPEVSRGLRLLEARRCTQCHTTDGSKQVGPTLLGYFGSKVTVTTDGKTRTLLVDEAHVRRAIKTPNADVLDGYTANTMPVTFVSRPAIRSIVAALKHLAEPAPQGKQRATEEDGTTLWVILAALVFAFGHFILCSTPVRTRIIARKGLGAFQGLVSLFAAVGLTWYLWAYFTAPYEPLWTPPLWTRWPPVLVMPVVMILMIGSFIPSKTRHGGVKAITRHPQLWAQGLWGLAHLPANGDVASVALFGGFSVLCFGGMWHIERRHRDHPPEGWIDLASATSSLPFAAVFSGRASLRLTDLWLAIVAGLGTFIAFLVVHEALVGVSPYP